MTAVYRAYDDEGRLLYVGITDNLWQRIKAHAVMALESPWVDTMVALRVEYHPTRRAAQLAELAAIHAEEPLWNVVGSPRARQASELRRAAQAAHRVNDDLDAQIERVDRVSNDITVIWGGVMRQRE